MSPLPVRNPMRDDQDAAAPQPAGQRIAIAIPLTKRSSKLVNADGTVNIDALREHLATVEAKIRLGFTNYEKNTGRKHPSDVRGVERRGAGDHLTWTDDQSHWLAKPITVDFDTGSSNNGHTIQRDPSSSSTPQDLGQSFSLPYDGDGSTVSGEQHTDSTVSIAGFSTLGAANTHSSEFQGSRFRADGLMGTAFQSISDFNASPVFQTLVSAGRMESRTDTLIGTTDLEQMSKLDTGHCQ
ncbi:hypothetical protein JVT61DRAFT_6854 [Boletus reticuloceps]|uniref:Peptidase A1 domain-containing protein n=1 Tax=Boletus reticuloceps TaxID=495285 RepID=A0A8I2YL73_9AGAM|nr:hypothetical protein JVT61DRAFT_6854 [Boletus reticuloceps]